MPCSFELNPTFSRRLLLAYWIDHLKRPSVPALIQETGWPRRTIQDILKALPSFGVEIEFVEDGVRHNDGYYQIHSWGPIKPTWIKAHLEEIKTAIG